MSDQDYFSKDYYKTLGVSKDASEQEIKKAYRKLIRQYHPDKNPDNKLAEEKSKEINEAYSVIGDKNERKKYDQIRAMAGGGPRFSSGGAGGFEDLFGGGFNGFGANSQSFNLNDIFGGIGGMFGHQTPNNSQPSYDFQPETKPVIDKTYKISYRNAVFGATMIHTFKDGEKVKFKIKPETQSGKTLRLTSKSGQIERIELKIKVPSIQDLNHESCEKAKKLLKDFEETVLGK